MIVSSLFGINL